MLNTWPSAGSDINFHKQIIEEGKKKQGRKHFHGKVKNRICKDSSSFSFGLSVVPWKTSPTGHMLLQQQEIWARTPGNMEKSTSNSPSSIKGRDREPSGKMKENQAGELTGLSMSFPKCSLVKESVIRPDPSPEISAWYQLELGLPSQQKVCPKLYSI